MYRRPLAASATDAYPAFVRLRPGLPVARHPHQDDARIAFAQNVVTKAPLLQRAGPEVLDDDVGALDEVEEQFAAAGDAQVQRHRLLVAGMHRPEDVVSVQLGLAPGAQRVGLPGRLDLDHLGAHVAEQPAGERPGDQRADLDHADAVERAGDRHPTSSEKPWRVSQSVQMPTACRSVSRWSGPA